MTRDHKEKIQYGISVGLIVAGILMGFLSFFLNHYDIEDGTLIYIAQCFVAGGSFMGVAVYLDRHIQELVDVFKNDKEENNQSNRSNQTNQTN